MTEPSDKSEVDGAPSDLELMMFADNELDEPRRAVVAAFIGGSTDAKLKLQGMSVVGAFVKMDADRLATAFRADDIANAVLREVGEPKKVVSIADAKPRSIHSPVKTLASEPKNDNARRIYGLAALAAAAAIGLGVWGRGVVAPAPPTDDSAAHAGLADIARASEPPPFIAQPLAKLDPPKDDGPAVAVASVDFGSQTGAVYYVPSDDHGATTTVVWLATR